MEDDLEVGTEETLDAEIEEEESVQYDDVEPPLETEGEHPPEEDQEEEEESPAPVKAKPPIAAASNRLNRLKENLDPEIFEDLMGYMEERIQHGIQTSSYASVQAAQAAQQMPNLFKIHGPQIQQYVNELSPEMRTSPNAMRFAIGRLVMEETEANDGDIAATLARLSKLAGNAPAGKKPAPKTAPPASQRVPSSGNSGGSPRVAPASAVDRQIGILMNRYGVSKAEAREMLNDERIR